MELLNGLLLRPLTFVKWASIKNGVGVQESLETQLAKTAHNCTRFPCVRGSDSRLLVSDTSLFSLINGSSAVTAETKSLLVSTADFLAPLIACFTMNGSTLSGLTRGEREKAGGQDLHV
jgi:hypothetical protein